MLAVRICLIHPRLSASRSMRINTPPSQTESIMGIRASSHAVICCVVLICSDDDSKMIWPLNAILSLASGNMMMKVDRDIMSIIHNAIVEMVYRM